MRKIKFLFQTFSMVTGFVVIAAAFFTTVLEPQDTVGTEVLWQIPGVSALCALGSLIYPWDTVMSGREKAVRIFLHYLYINVTVLGAGRLFEWYHFRSVKSVVAMTVCIAVIFALVSAISWRRAAEDARRMNERLREYQRQE